MKKIPLNNGLELYHEMGGEVFKRFLFKNGLENKYKILQEMLKTHRILLTKSLQMKHEAQMMESRLFEILLIYI